MTNMWNRLGKILFVIGGMIFAILYIIGAVGLCIISAIVMFFEILLFIPFGILWLITGKSYTGKMSGWLDRLLDNYFPI